MTINKIVIKELSSKAEIINIFNCMSGNISILTGADTAIQSLERALSGTYEKNDLRISVDDSITFNSTEHVLIGYNNIFKDSTKSVEDVFNSYNFESSDIDVILNTYGLHNIRNLKIYELDDDKKKRLEYAIGFQSEDKALIIKKPFKDIISQWKEPIAKSIYTYAAKKNLPVIITELDYDSSLFNNINNIKKYKLGISTTKTIGFGTNNQDLKDFISQIRNEMNNDDNSYQNSHIIHENDLKKTQDPIKITGEPITNVMPEILQEIIINDDDEKEALDINISKNDIKKFYNKLFIIGFILLISSVVIVALLLKVKSDTNLKEIETRKEILKKDLTPKVKIKKNYESNTPFILDNYPEWIKHDVELQLKTKEILKSKSFMPLIKRGNQVKNDKSSNNLFKLLEEVSGSGKDLPDSSQNYHYNSGGYNQRSNNNTVNQNNNNNNYQNNASEAEAKRQLLYQRFQEAIRRSREKK